MRFLPAVVPAEGERPSNASADHPMRIATRRIAFDPDGWTPALAAEVEALFDGLAPEWHTRHPAQTAAVVVDALERGGPAPAGTWLELGSGSGLLTPALVGRARRVLAVDLSLAMLRRAPAGAGIRVQADGARLPVPDGSVDVLVLANTFLFPAEARRVVAAGGLVVWANAYGEGTPIHLPAGDVERALGAGWSGVASTIGHGSWAVLHR